MNWTDYLIIAIIGLSLLAGVMRGLLREVIALVSWILAIWLAWKFAPRIEPYLGGVLNGGGVRPWAARAIVFIGVLLVGALVGLLVSHFVRLSLFSGMDRFLGALFGLLRGAVMVGVLVMLCHTLQLQQEPWWRRSLLVPYAERVGNVLRGMVGERKIAAGHPVTASL